MNIISFISYISACTHIRAHLLHAYVLADGGQLREGDAPVLPHPQLPPDLPQVLLLTDWVQRILQRRDGLVHLTCQHRGKYVQAFSVITIWDMTLLYNSVDCVVIQTRSVLMVYILATVISYMEILYRSV